MKIWHLAVFKSFPYTTMRPLTRSLAHSFLFLVGMFLASTGAERQSGFSLGIRDSLMIAHSFHNHPSFGPAGGMHGATYTCDVEFLASQLVKEVNWVIDIGKASSILANILAKYNYKNLDEVFPNGELTTTEFMCRQIHMDLCAELKELGCDFQGSICVKLWESHKAWASFTDKVAS